MRALDLLGAGLLLAWIALPVLLRVGRTRTEQAPAIAYRNLLVALLLSVTFIALPWIRTCLPRLSENVAPVQLSLRVLATETSGIAGRPRGLAISPFGLLAIAWGAAFAVACARAMVARVRLGRLLARCTAAPAELQRALDIRADACGARRARLLLTHEVETPFSARILSPVVVVSTGLIDELEADDLDLVLRHELTHIRRQDPLTNALARVCAAIFALHPSIPGLLRELTMAREASVDAVVAPRAPHAYATLLVEMASRVRFGEELAHVSMDDTALARRIAMLTNETQLKKPSSTALFLGAAAIAVASLLAPQVFAEEGKGHVFFRGADGPQPHADELRACYDEARKEKSDLTIDTLAELTLDEKWNVVTANVPTPASPTFQQCVEQKALTWNFPPPPDAPPPPKDMPKDAKRMVAFHIAFHP